MVQINFARKEINCKVVYYGPGLSGKTTNLEVVHARTPDTNKGELTSISTDGDRTLFFDFMPLDLGTVAGMKTKFHLYTVPGQVYYNSTRKLVLLGADGIIFVADSSPDRTQDNIQSLENLRENLAEMGRDLGKIPLVIQYNKRDLPGCLDVEELEKALNKDGRPSFEASAKTGEGVFQTLKAISALVLESINSSEGKRTAASGRDLLPESAAAGDSTDPTRPAGECAEPPAEAVEKADLVSSDAGEPADPGNPAGPELSEEPVPVAPVAGLKRERRRDDVLRPVREPISSSGELVDVDAEEVETAVATVAAPVAARTRRVQSGRSTARRAAARTRATAAPQRVTRGVARSRAVRRSSGSKAWVYVVMVIVGAAAAAVAAWKFMPPM